MLPWTTPDFTTLIDAAYTDGARISNNSWGLSGATAQYNTASQEYDGLVRDGRPSTAPSGGSSGNQEMVIVFSAGNNGPGASNLGDYGSTAKNTIVVAAGENFNATGDNDGCIGGGCCGDGDADDMRQIIGFSSRGPTADGRVKPDIAAPGTHIMCAASQDPNFDGSSVCGSATNDGALPNADAFYPPDPDGSDAQAQTLYTWSSGTSHSAPAVAGGAALLRQWFLNHGQPPPSPAMTKAFLMNSSTYMTGPADNLPSNSQGVGRMNLGIAFDNTPRLLFDQVKTAHSNAAADAAELFTVTGTVADNTRPFRVSLAYTDAPGTPGAGVIANNDLDLEVDVGGTTYRGNVNFTAGLSGAAGAASADTLNNAESVFLPAGTTGPFTVRVRPSNINSDGVANNGDTTDQDFALVIYNGQFPPRNPVDTILVLDVSGSMGDIAPGGTATKIELLKDAVEMFIRAWEPFSIPGDRMGIVYFSSGIAATLPPAAPLLLPFQTNADTFINDVRSRSAFGCTALGAGILTAVNGFDALPDHQRHVIVFTNGMQNRSPMVTTASPHQIVADASADCGDSGIPGNPGVNIADFGVKAIHTIGVGAFGAEWTTLLATIASETGGLNHVTNTPDEDLEDFFLDNLVQTLRVDPVEKAATRTGSLASGQENKIEPFDIDGTARKATFAVSWHGDRRVGAVGYDLIAPNGIVIPSNLIQVKEGPFYRVGTVTFPLGAIPHAGTWKLRFRPHLQAPKVDYRITLIVDEADIRYSFEVPTNSRGVGEPIPMSLWVMKETRAVTGLQSVRATISRPPIGIGTFLSTHAVSPDILSQTTGVNGDQFANAAAKKAFVLTKNDALRQQLAPVVDTIDFFDDGKPEHGDAKADDGIYNALYTNTQRPGTYRVVASFAGGGPELASVTRTEVRNVLVDMKRFDAAKSNVDIRQTAPGTYAVTARLIDSFDNFWGPGRNVSVLVSPPGKKWGPSGRRIALTDNLDGSYSGQITLTPAEASGGYDLVLDTDAGIVGKLSPPGTSSTGAPGTWGLSLHGGVTWPVGAFNNSYDSGPSVAVDVERRLTPSLSAVGVVEYDQFKGASFFIPDFYWWSISPKLKYELSQSGLRPYVTAGIGAYIPKQGSTKFGINAGVGLEYFWTPAWSVEIGADGHRVLGSGDTKFVVTHLGLIRHW